MGDLWKQHRVKLIELLFADFSWQFSIRMALLEDKCAIKVADEEPPWVVRERLEFCAKASNENLHVGIAHLFRTEIPLHLLNDAIHRIVNQPSHAAFGPNIFDFLTKGSASNGNGEFTDHTGRKREETHTAKDAALPSGQRQQLK